MSDIKEWLSLPAGPELDRIVAEKVMGWHSKVTKLWRATNVDNLCWLSGTEIVRHAADWSPSTNIAHAWEVVEKMRTMGWTLTLWDDEREDATAENWCAYFRNNSVSHLGQLTGTAPLAICRAALAAISGKAYA